jgi:hypothetical protein
MAWLAFACCVILQQSAIADAERPTIIAVLEETRAGFLSRLRGELASAGFDLVIVPPPHWPPLRQEIEELTRQRGAIAGITLVQEGTAVEMWVVDRVTNKTVFREIIGGPEQLRDDALAIRFVEILRATLMEVEQPRAEPGEVPAPPEVRSFVMPPAPSHFSVGLSGGVGYSPGGVGTTEHLGISFMTLPAPRFGFSIDALLTPGRAVVRGDEGQTSVALYFVGASFRACVLDPRGPVRLWLGTGAWVGWMNMRGEAVAPYANAQATTTSLLAHADAALRFFVTRRVAWGPSAVVAISVPGVAVEFADRRAATWGRPLWLGSLAVETTLD